MQEQNPPCNNCRHEIFSDQNKINQKIIDDFEEEGETIIPVKNRKEQSHLKN